jgi:hypothetical protein
MVKNTETVREMRAVRPFRVDDMEAIIQRIRNAPEGASITEIVGSLQKNGVPRDIIFLAYKASRILDNAASEFELKRALALKDTDHPLSPTEL